MSTSGQPFIVRDPVHGYLEVAAHERLVVDHPITQRLRRVNQTGLAEFVFPEARTSRLIHSLGAMHVASQFIVAAVENSTEEARKQFFDSLRDRITHSLHGGYPEQFEALWNPDASGAGRAVGAGLLAGRALLGGSRDERAERRNLLAYAEAGLRLAALYHDLGHLPLSHDFESALATAAHELKQKAVRKDEADKLQPLFLHAPHEVIGHRMANHVFRGLVAERSDVTTAVFELARDILNEGERPKSPTDPANALQWLHSLVDGDLDVDRADYLLRDGRALGLDFAHYDFDRLVKNLMMVHTPAEGFVLAVDDRGLSAVESFFLSRARSHHAFVRHHKSAQIATAFRYVTARMLQEEASKPFLKDLISIIDARLPSKDEANQLLDRFARYTDGWWLERMADAEGRGDELYEACRKLVLHRERTLRSVWKREGELPEDLTSRLNEAVLKLSGQKNKEVLRAVSTHLETQDKILLMAHKFKPYEPNFAKEIVSPGDGAKRYHSHLRIQVAKDRFVSATTLSPLMLSLEEDWRRSLHCHLFCLAERVLSAQEGVELLERTTNMVTSSSGGTASSAITP